MKKITEQTREIAKSQGIVYCEECNNVCVLDSDEFANLVKSDITYIISGSFTCEDCIKHATKAN